MLEIVDRLEQKLKQIDEQLSDPAVISKQKKMIELTRERRRLSKILECGQEFRRMKAAIDEARQIIAANEDNELVEMAREELAQYDGKIDAVESEFKMKLVPPDPNDEKPAIVEIRAGTGGDEAGLFAGEMYRMYQRYADRLGWKIEVLSSSPSEVGGFKEIIFSVEGDEPYGKMKYESGVHRVQRVPQTETQGRIHTSAVTVAVFPEAEEVDIEVAEKDLRIDVYRSSGPGGQSVNTTDSAVRVTHLPTGLVVTCQDEKSQHKNKAKALKILRARLLDHARQEKEKEISAQRKNQVGTGERSERIRTYNFPQGRVTDHRIGLTLYRLSEVLDGEIDEIIQKLTTHYQAEALKG